MRFPMYINKSYKMNKIALVTGGSRSIGREIALSIARNNNHVVITYNTNKDAAEVVVKEIEALGQEAVALQLDTSKTDNIGQFVHLLIKTIKEKWDATHIDYQINNAGIGASISIADVTEADFDKMMNVHFKSNFFLTQKLLPYLNNNGRVVNITSGATRSWVPGYTVYASAKSALDTFTKYLAMEVGARGITVNSVSPGPVQTDFNGAIIRNTPALQEFIKKQNPLGRVGMANDIGGVVAFLCTDDARWINGQRIEVSGGMAL